MFLYFSNCTFLYVLIVAVSSAELVVDGIVLIRKPTRDARYGLLNPNEYPWVMDNTPKHTTNKSRDISLQMVRGHAKTRASA